MSSALMNTLCPHECRIWCCTTLSLDETDFSVISSDDRNRILLAYFLFPGDKRQAGFFEKLL